MNSYELSSRKSLALPPVLAIDIHDPGNLHNAVSASSILCRRIHVND